MRRLRGSALMMASVLLSAGSNWTQSASAAAGTHPPMRDPTLPPAALRQLPPPLAASAPAGATRLDAPVAGHPPRTLLMIDGRRYVVNHGRRYGVGDTLGTARIERIDETVVWVRQGGKLRALPMYGSVVKRAPAAAGAPEPGAATPGQSPVPNIRKTLVTGESP